jgi:hypothetical protein
LRTEPTFWARRAVLEQDQRRDVADAELGGVCGFGLDIDLGDAQLVFVLARDLVEDRRDHLAGDHTTLPRNREDGLVGLQDVLAERSVRGVHDIRVTHVEGSPWDQKSWGDEWSGGFLEAVASRRQKPCSGRDQTVRLRHAANWPDGPLMGKLT